MQTVLGVERREGWKDLGKLQREDWRFHGPDFEGWRVF